MLDDVVMSATAPVMVAQVLISQGYIDGPLEGDPALTLFPSLEQFRTEYLLLTPATWTENWIVVTAEVGSEIFLDAADTDTGLCSKGPGGPVGGVSYESRRCPVGTGVHVLSGAKPFGVAAYGYGSGGSYALVGGTDVKRIYDVPAIP